MSSFNARLLKKLSELDWDEEAFIHIFLPIAGHNEPDMCSFIADIRTRSPLVNIVVSQSNPNDCSMKHFLLTDHVVLKKNAWGIVEPVDGEVVAETQLDIVLIPLLVVDKAGNRVGYGKGFYDRFLAKCRPDCRKIGVSIFEPIDKIDDVDPLDVPLDAVVTPKGVIKFK